MGPLDHLNAAPADELTPTLLACCDVPAWADAVLTGRPYARAEDLYAVADRAARRFSSAEVDRALAAHPRIGQRAQGNGAGAGWSRQEQSGVSQDAAVQQALLEGNRAYEDRFDRVFLVRAAGRDADEILAELTRRLGNDPATERAETTAQLAEITRLRVERMVDR